MSMTESRVVQISFDNKDFENNVKQSLDTLNRLNNALEFKDGAKGLNHISKASKDLDLSGIDESVQSASRHFSTLEVMGVTALANLANSAVNAGKNIVNSIINPIKQGGWQRALNMEQAKFMFNGLLGPKAKEAIGNVGEIGTIMDNIYQSVDGTIYSLDRAALVAARLMASNVNAIGEGAEIVNVLKGVAGVASVFNADYSRVGDLFTTVKSSGAMMGQVALSLKTMGIPVYATLSEYLNNIIEEGREAGKSLNEIFPGNEEAVKYISSLGENVKLTEADIEELQRKGAISFEIFSDAMYTAYGEQASKSKEIFVGALEDMKAAAARIGEKIYGPFVGKDGKPGILRDILNAAVPLLDSINARLSVEGGVFEKFGNKVRSIGDKIVLAMDLISMAIDPKTTVESLNSMVEKGLADKSRLANLEKYAYVVARIGDAIRTLSSIFSVLITTLGAVYGVAKNAFQFIVGLLETILTVISGAMTPLKALRKTVKVWGKDLGSFIAAMTKIIVNSQAVSNITATISDLFMNLDKAIKKVSKSVVELTKTFTKIVHVLATGLAKTIKGVHKELKGLIDITSIFNTAIITSLMIKVGKFLELLKGSGMSFGAIFGDFAKRFGGSILNNLRKSSVLFSEAMDQLRVTLIAYQKNLKAGILLRIAGAILALAIALKILSSLNAQQLMQGILALAAIGGILIVVMKQLTSVLKMMSGFNVKQLAAMQLMKGFMMSMALAILGMAVAVKMLGSLDTEQAINGLLGLVAVAGIMYVLFKAMAKVQKAEGAASVAKLLVIVLSLDLLTAAFVALGHMKWSGIKKATVAMSIMAGMIVALQFVMNKISKVQNVASILPLMGMAIAIGMFANTFRKLALLEWGDIERGTVAMLVCLGMVTILFTALNGIKMNAFASALALSKITSTISTMFKVFLSLAEMDYGQIKRAAVGLAVLEGAIGALLLMLHALTVKGGLTKTEIVESVITMGLLSTIGTLVKKVANAFIKLGGMSWGELGKAAAGMGGILLIVGALVGMSKLVAKTGSTKDLLAFAGVLVLLGLGFKVFAAGIAAMGGMKITVLGVGILGVAAAILVLNGVAKLVSKTFVAFLKMTAGMVAFGLGLAAIGAGALVMGFGLASLASALKNLTTEDVVRIATLVAVMALISPIVKGIGVSFMLFGAGVAVVGIGLIAVGAGLAAAGLGFKILVNSVAGAVDAINSFADLDFSAVFKLAGLVTIFGLLSPLIILFGAALLAAGGGLAAFGGGVKVIVSGLRAIKSLIAHLFDGIGEKLVKMCTTAVSTLKKLIPQVKDTVKIIKTISTHIRAAIKVIYNLYSEAYQAGKHVVEGVINGIRNNASSAAAAARSMARATLAAYKDEMGISSPSKKMAELARWDVLGFVRGMKHNTPLAVSTMSDFANAVLNAYEYVQDNVDTSPTITPVVDMSNVEDSVRSLNGMMSSDRAIRLSSELTNTQSPRSILANELLNGMRNGTNNTSTNYFNITVDGAENPEDFADRLLRRVSLKARTT